MLTGTMLVASAALAVGVLVGWLAARAHASRGQAQAAADLAAASARLDESARRSREAEQVAVARDRALADAQAQVARLREEQGGLIATIEGERQLADQKLALLRDAETKLREAFATLSADALHRNATSFLELAKASLAEHQRAAATDLEMREKAVADLVAPLRESLAKVDATLQHVEKDRHGAYMALTEQIKQVSAGQQGLQAETANLVKALREPKARGRWGEIQLRRVVELAGMVDHCDFYEQQSMATEASRLVPDMVVRLPGERSLIVDAKVPLTAYLEATEAEDEATREAKLKDHARQVRDHVKRLSAKAYWEQVQPAPEFVVMFLPGEAFFGAALLHDATLIEAGVAERVILASPITLIALLRAVAHGWQQERIAANAQAISDEGRALFERLRVVVEHLDRLGLSLGKAVEAYNGAVASVESRLLPSARRLKELGSASDREVPALEGVDRIPRRFDEPDLTG